MRIKSKLFKSITTLILSATLTFNAFAEKKLTTSLKAMDIAKKMECGWNLGNTLEARDNWSPKSKVFPFNEGLGSETDWSEELTTKAIIETGIKNGYKTIRIPVTWCNHLVDTNYTIDSQWMARVKQIVDWSIDAGYYVILNEHHSVHDEMNSPIKHCEGYNVSSKDEKETKAFLQAIWKQITATFNNDYDEHLIFETMNEPRNTAHEHCWNPEPKTCQVCKADVQLLNEYNQLILDTIRASGGNNANRFVMIPGIGTSISTALADYFAMPKDSAKDKLMITVHMYPLDAGGTGRGSHHFNAQTKNEILFSYDKLNNKFSKKGIPVVLGECGATKSAITYWDNGVEKKITDYVVTYEDRLKCFSFIASQTGKYSMPMINWDCGGVTGMATVDRKKCRLFEPEYTAAVIKAWKEANANPASITFEIEDTQISLDKINIWDASKSSYDNKKHILSLGAGWQGGDIWLGEIDLTNYPHLIFNLTTTAAFNIEVRYKGEESGKKFRFEKNSKSLKIPLDKKKKLVILLFQAENEAAEITFDEIYLSTK